MKTRIIKSVADNSRDPMTLAELVAFTSAAVNAAGPDGHENHRVDVRLNWRRHVRYIKVTIQQSDD